MPIYIHGAVKVKLYHQQLKVTHEKRIVMRT
uniref:Uncharacterized protein n=1 Tax=Anguilla anguilla TaxID=7936 RepID=A0A0E9R5Q5_ANGAN